MTYAIVGVALGEGGFVAMLVGETWRTIVVGVGPVSVAIVTGEVDVGIWVGSSEPHKLVPQDERSIPVRTNIIIYLCKTEFIGQIIPHLFHQYLPSERFPV